MLHQKIKEKLRREFELLKTDKKQFIEDLIEFAYDLEDTLPEEEIK